jgi:hypothetical protein
MVSIQCIELMVDLPTITEDETEGYFTEISPDEFTPTSNVARKFLLLTFVILVVSAKSRGPVTIDSRWYLPPMSVTDNRILHKACELLRARNTTKNSSTQNSLILRRDDSRLSLRFISYCAF